MTIAAAPDVDRAQQRHGDVTGPDAGRMVFGGAKLNAAHQSIGAQPLSRSQVCHRGVQIDVGPKAGLPQAFESVR